MHSAMKPLRRLLLVALLLLLDSCTVGSARSFDMRRDLTGLDLNYLRSRVGEQHFENEQTVDGQLTGFPFWFLPAVGLRIETANALHHGQAESQDPENTGTSSITGFEHSDLRTLGGGLLTHQHDYATWNSAGELQNWQRTNTIGAGILWSSSYAGEGAGDRWHSMNTHVLAGAFGYTEERGRGYLKLLWVPIPVRW